TPSLDLPNSPFYVNNVLSEWKANHLPRRAGVSSFGIGGTNAHLILEEAPAIQTSPTSWPAHLVVISARTETALRTSSLNLADYIEKNPDLHLADVAHTLQTGRKAFDHRQIVVCRNRNEAINLLRSPKRGRISGLAHQPPNVAFMFPGQGSQYLNMGSELYGLKTKFREQVDECSNILTPHLGFDIRTVLFPDQIRSEEAAEHLKETRVAQPALFVIEYALAQLWMDWGVRPQVMVGHSIGEYVAACLAGVFSLNEALALVATRAELMQSLPEGAMLAVSLTREEIDPWLNSNLDLAAVNGQALCVISGPTTEITELEERLRIQCIACRRLDVTRAFHSRLTEPILTAFTEKTRTVNLLPPKIP